MLTLSLLLLSYSGGHIISQFWNFEQKLTTLRIPYESDSPNNCVACLWVATAN